jgi:hypothetical protein
MSWPLAGLWLSNRLGETEAVVLEERGHGSEILSFSLYHTPLPTHIHPSTPHVHTSPPLPQLSTHLYSRLLSHTYTLCQISSCISQPVTSLVREDPSYNQPTFHFQRNPQYGDTDNGCARNNTRCVSHVGRVNRATIGHVLILCQPFFFF